MRVSIDGAWNCCDSENTCPIPSVASLVSDGPATNWTRLCLVEQSLALENSPSGRAGTNDTSDRPHNVRPS